MPQRSRPGSARSEELSRLLDLWHDASRGAGQLVLVAGDAGVGKSRLVQALGERIGGAPFYRICYQCSPYHVDSAFHPFIHQLEKTAGFAPGEATSSRLDKVRRLLGGASPALAGAMPLFAELLSLPMEGSPQSWPPEQRRNETMAAILGRLRELASQRPVLLVLEDAHWIDPSTLDLLGLLAAQLPSLPVLLVVTSRVADIRQAWLQGPRASVLNLQRLAPREAAELANLRRDADAGCSRAARAGGRARRWRALVHRGTREGDRRGPIHRRDSRDAATIC
jgi:predicted ATPase